jgi:hypothetical protein
MDLAKFLSILQTKNLYFSRADKLGDPFEGSITKGDHALRKYIQDNRNTDPRLSGYKSLTDDQLNTMFRQEEFHNREKLSSLFVNCWHMNEHESAAMWRLYGQSTETICLQSTFHRLASALPSYVNAGTVKYIDYESDYIPANNSFNSIMTKRMSYAHEREVRAVAWSGLSGDLGGDTVRENMTKDGLPIPVDLQALIERIYVSPTSALWFRQIVERLLEPESLKISIMQSSLASTPIY